MVFKPKNNIRTCCKKCNEEKDCMHPKQYLEFLLAKQRNPSRHPFDEYLNTKISNIIAILGNMRNRKQRRRVKQQPPPTHTGKQ